jgi:ech hydrogenase subunit A
MVESRGYYLTGFFHETTLIRYGGLGTAALIALMIGGAAL